MPLTTEQVIELAKKNFSRKVYEAPEGELSGALVSASLCLNDANYAIRHGNPALARNRAVASLRHSVGIFHEDFEAAIE